MDIPEIYQGKIFRVLVKSVQSKRFIKWPLNNLAADLLMPDRNQLEKTKGQSTYMKWSGWIADYTGGSRSSGTHLQL